LRIYIEENTVFTKSAIILNLSTYVMRLRDRILYYILWLQ